MSERDVLRRAAKALREANPGANTGSGFTRARIMRSLHDRNRKRITRWFVLGPLAALFLGGSAWAQMTGQLPELLQHAREWVVNVYAPGEGALAVHQTGSPAHSRTSASSASPRETSSGEPPNGEAQEDEALLDAELAALDAFEEEAPEAPAVEAPAEPSAPEPSIARARPRLAPSVASDEPREAPPDPELLVFRAAHDRHFGGAAPAEAIRAYRVYLEQYPNGRFVPEARYNTALNLLRTGERARARELLEAFARGDYGGYRRERAGELLEALRAEEP